MAATIEFEATYEVVTPLFCGGADPQHAEFRLPSFKGVLRYWWRALVWSRFAGDLGAIQRAEQDLFGSAEKGQAKVLMRLSRAPDARQVAVQSVLTASLRNKQPVGDGARYLGYGVMDAFDGRMTKAGRLTHACLRAPFDFTVQFRCRDLHRKTVDSLTDALKVVGLLGGMGAKSRKGYGSLALRSLDGAEIESWSRPRSIDDLREAMASLLPSDGPGDLPEFTALSPQTRVVLVAGRKKEPLDLLDLVGRELVRYRSWGRNGRILGGSVRRENNFEDDHDLMKSPAEQRRSHPRRIAFGLPHNYGKQQVGPCEGGLDRRASPLFIHIHRCGETPVAVLSLLPARFLPPNRSDIVVGGTRVAQAPEETLYEPIHDFLDRLVDPDRRKEDFVTAMEIER